MSQSWLRQSAKSLRHSLGGPRADNSTARLNRWIATSSSSSVIMDGNSSSSFHNVAAALTLAVAGGYLVTNNKSTSATACEQEQHHQQHQQRDPTILGKSLSSLSTTGSKGSSSSSSSSSSRSIEVRTAQGTGQNLPVFTAKQVAVNNGENGKPVWMSHGGNVYDVTQFIQNHPGGSEKILLAAGSVRNHLFLVVPCL
jgi:cytochrome b involved in lipid metabolism